MINMKSSVQFAVAAAALLSASASQAQLAVSADAGSTGIGAHLIVPMEKTLNGRFGGNAFNSSNDERAGGVDYDMKTKRRSFDILFDWYLFDHPQLHATAGVIYNGNKVTATGKPGADGKYTINGHSYTAADVGSLTGKLEYRKAAPYLGIGWGNPFTSAKNWTLTGDLGVMFQGKPKTHLVSLGCVTSTIVCTILARDVALEKPQFQSDIESYKAYPVVRVGVAYRF